MKYKSERKRQILYFFTHTWNLRKKHTKIEENKLLDTEIRLVVAKGEEGHLYGDGLCLDL